MPLRPIFVAFQVGRFEAAGSGEVAVDSEGAVDRPPSGVVDTDLLGGDKVVFVAPEGGEVEGIVGGYLVTETDFIGDVDFGVEVGVAQIGEGGLVLVEWVEAGVYEGGVRDPGGVAVVEEQYLVFTHWKTDTHFGQDTEFVAQAEEFIAGIAILFADEVGNGGGGVFDQIVDVFSGGPVLESRTDVGDESVVADFVIYVDGSATGFHTPGIKAVTYAVGFGEFTGSYFNRCADPGAGDVDPLVVVEFCIEADGELVGAAGKEFVVRSLEGDLFGEVIVPEGGDTAIVEEAGPWEYVGEAIRAGEFASREGDDAARVVLSFYDFGPPVEAVGVCTETGEETA